jgi:type IV secretory pathway VirB10-like protein
MAATFMAGGPRRRKSPITFGRVAVVVGVALAIAVAWNMLTWQSVSDRPNEMKTTAVILPPPPPPPPPPEPIPQEKPPEPVEAPPIEEPVDTPPPPDQSNSEPTPGDSALTAREGAGPAYSGLRVGDGSGTRIGGRPGGGDAFRAYASSAQACIQRAAQSDRELAKGRYNAALTVTMAGDGRFANARVSGVDERRAAQIRELLSGLKCPAPPAGLPVMRLTLSTRSGG